MTTLKQVFTFTCSLIMVFSVSSFAKADITKADEQASFDEYQAIVQALQPYIQNASTGDGKKMRESFYDHALVVGSIGGKFNKLDLDGFEKAITDSGPAPKVKHHIAWIDISGPAAAAKVEFVDWGGLRFTDFFVLYKHDGEWKISSKVYDTHTNN